MSLKLCQGPKCHTYTTQDRLKGTKGNKTFQTRRRSSFYYGNGNFCAMGCQDDWFIDFGDRAIDHFGRTTKAKHLTEQNAWTKDWDYPTGDYMGRENRTYVFRNAITKETRPLTEEQYNDTSYTINTGE